MYNFNKKAVYAVLSLAAVAIQPPAHAGDGGSGGTTAAVLYSGRATAVDATVKVLTSSHHLSLADTGELGPDGTTRQTTVLTDNNPPPLTLSSATMDSVIGGDGGTSASSSETEKLLLAVGAVTITADLIEAHANARCDQSSQTVATSGGSTLVNIQVNGTPIAYSGQPNTKYTIPGVVSITLNEQYNSDVNTQVVNALHVTVPGAPGVASADVVVSHAEAGILSCPCNQQ